MHLLEASLAWREIDAEPVWDQLADEIVELCLAKFIDRNGALHEFFGKDWSPAPGIDGRIVEPGHQFEWAWLLERWSRLRNRVDTHTAAQRMFEIASTYGIDLERGVAMNELLDDFTVHEPNARLWPQTERIKAAVILAESADTPASRKGYLAEAVAGVQGLRKYLDVPIGGLWRDKMRLDGSFIDESAPASSFYHIVCAISELRARI
jgi:mannose-6-phosphate isomerase